MDDLTFLVASAHLKLRLERLRRVMLHLMREGRLLMSRLSLPDVGL
jgi:hypothetical protein